MDVLDGLNPEQRRAAEAVRGPGLHPRRAPARARRRRSRGGSRSRSPPGTFRADEILAVTFTDKAAGEMKLAARGARGAAASRRGTFHSAALAAAPPLRARIGRARSCRRRRCRCGRSRTRCRRRTSSGRRATSRPRSSGRRRGGSRRTRYRADARGARAADPGRPDAHASTASTSGARQTAARSTSRICSSSRSGCSRATSRRARRSATATARSRSTSTRTSTCSSRRCSSSGSATRDDLCVVGDDYQSIYAFTGASPERLLGVAARFPDATVVRLEENYRSTPEVLELANRLVPLLGGAEKVLRPTRDDGPEPGRPAFATPEAEGRALVEAIRALGGPLEEMASAAGYRVGLFTSPHLIDFRERIRLGHTWITEQEVIDGVAAIRAEIEPAGIKAYALRADDRARFSGICSGCS